MPPIVYSPALAGLAAGYFCGYANASWLATGNADWHAVSFAYYCLYEDLFLDAPEASRVRLRVAPAKRRSA